MHRSWPLVAGMGCKDTVFQCSGLLPNFLKRTLTSFKDEMAHGTVPSFFLLCKKAGIYWLCLPSYAFV